eukprot:Ihof_evm20s6 gene=Ihof_evmTU20s6
MGFLNTLVDIVATWLAAASPMEALLVISVIVLSTAYVIKSITDAPPKGVKFPPRVPHKIPFLGCAPEFGTKPIEFLHNAYKTYGPVFTFRMMGRDCTYVIGNEASALMFNSKNEDLNAEEVYGNLTIPIFGKGVAYDVDSKEFGEQKRLMKTGLTIERFKQYVSMIEEETHEYLKRFGDEGEMDLFKSLAELVIMTASRCLLGPEIRALLDESIAGLFADMDGSFTAAGWLLPHWLPLPAFRKRDAAHRKMMALFVDVVEKRKKEGNVDHGDLISTFMNTPYRNGTYLTSTQVGGMCIAALLAGQHTSSTTGSWMGYFIANDKALQDKLRKEALDAMEDGHVTFDGLKQMEDMDCTLKETLRLRPPIMTMMRVVKTPQQIMGYTIPVGNYCCASPTTNHILDEAWPNALTFNPDRFKGTTTDEDAEESNMAGKGKFSYVPFGAGRHRCIGEIFAYTQ